MAETITEPCSYSTAAGTSTSSTTSTEVHRVVNYAEYLRLHGMQPDDTFTANNNYLSAGTGAQNYQETPAFRRLHLPFVEPVCPQTCTDGRLPITQGIAQNVCEDSSTPGPYRWNEGTDQSISLKEGTSTGCLHANVNSSEKDREQKFASWIANGRPKVCPSSTSTA